MSHAIVKCVGIQFSFAFPCRETQTQRFPWAPIPFEMPWATKGTARTTGSGSCTQIFETTLRVAWIKCFDPPTNYFKIGYTEKNHKNPTVYRVSPLLHALMRSRDELKRCTVRTQRGTRAEAWGPLNFTGTTGEWYDKPQQRQRYFWPAS